MKVYLTVLLAIFVLGQLGRINLPGNEVALPLNDLAVGLVVLSGLITKRRLIKNWFYHPLFRALLVFAVAIVLSLFVNLPNLTIRQLAIAGLYPLRFFVYAGLYFVFKDGSREENIYLLKLFTIAILAVAILGLLQYVFIPDVSFLAQWGWDDHYYRLVGTFLDPGFTGAILALGLLMVFQGQRVLNPGRFYYWPIMAVIYMALALTYSRASYLMYLAAFAVIAFFKRSPKILVVAALVIAVTIPLLPQSTGEGTRLSRENSIYARIQNWQQSLRIWTISPVLGVGFDAYRYTREKLNPELSQSLAVSHAGAGADSSLLLVLATTGLVGFICFLNLLRVMWLTGRNNLIFTAGLLAILIHSWFNNTLFYPWVMEWLWLMLAVRENI